MILMLMLFIIPMCQNNNILLVCLLSSFCLVGCGTKQLTIEEKINLVVGTSEAIPNPPYPAPDAYRRDNPTEEALQKANTYRLQTSVKGAGAESYAIPRLNMPGLVFADGPQGVRIDPIREGDTTTYYCTAFPIGSCLGASWNTKLVREVGQGIGAEARKYGVDILLAPGMNLMRNPLCGRNFEYYSEDPVLSGNIAAAYVQGVQSKGIGVSLKHFVCNNSETFRNGLHTEVNEKAFRELYLKGFEIAVKQSRPWTIMASYNKLDSTYTTESKILLTDILRNEWGYEGVVLTDWWGEHDPVAMLRAGCDMMMPGFPAQKERIYQAISTGEMTEQELDVNVDRVLDLIKKCNHNDFSDALINPQLPTIAALEGAVLLKNDAQILPLKPTEAFALFGTGSYRCIAGGSGSGYVHCAHKVSLHEAMARRSDIILDTTIENSYLDYLQTQKGLLDAENFWWIPSLQEPVPNADLLEKASQQSSAAIITLTRISGEGTDRSLTKGDYYLTDEEQELINSVSEVYHADRKPVVIILQVGGIIEMTTWQDKVDAILLTWLGGEQAGEATCQLLMGEASPSGKLPMSVPVRYKNLLSSQNFPLSPNESSWIRYKEGMAVGYRQGGDWLYPFGYGLSYTTFEYKDFQLLDDWTIQVKVTNTGAQAGKDVVQVYVSYENEMPVLKAFSKTRLLQPDETETITFVLTADDLKTWNETTHQWTFPKGNYTIHIANQKIQVVI